MADPFISEIRYAGPPSGDFAEVAISPQQQKAGCQLVVYHRDGTMRGIYALGPVETQVAGYDLHHVATTGIARDGAIALTRGGVLACFLSFTHCVTAVEGPAIGRDSRRIGDAGGIGQTLVSGDGIAYRPHAGDSGALVPGFLAGTIVGTPYGPRPVEALRNGDMVETDEGQRVLRYVGRRTLAAAFANAHALQPVKIPAHSFGPNAPMHDLFLSPDQRICLGSKRFTAFFDRSEVMVPAAQLVGWRGIRRALRLETIPYVHLLFETPCTVMANGLPVECFHPAAPAAMHLCREARRALLLRFPDLMAAPGQPSPAEAPSLKRHEIRLALRLLDLPDAA